MQCFGHEHKSCCNACMLLSLITPKNFKNNFKWYMFLDGTSVLAILPFKSVRFGRYGNYFLLILTQFKRY